jgi:hypothetical protein
MKKILLFFTIILISKSYCFSQNDDDCIRKSLGKYYSLDIKKLQEWRNDSTGCNGKRSETLQNISGNKLLIGMPKNIFFIFFGKPNEIENGGSCIYYITITCDKNKKQISNTDYYYWVIVFKDDKVEMMLSRLT